MTQKDFFRIVLKLFGLYLLFQLIYTIFNQLEYIIFYFNNFGLMMSLFVPIIINSIIAWILIFKTDKIIDLFKLIKNDESVEINIGDIKSITFVKIGLVILSCYLLLSNIAPFLTNTFLSFKRSVKEPNVLNEILTGFDLVNVDYMVWIASGVNIVLGYLILSNFDRISNWIFKDLESKEKEEIDQL